VPRAAASVAPARLERWSRLAAIVLGAVLALSLGLALAEQPWPWTTWVLFALLADLALVAGILARGADARPRRRALGAAVLVAATLAGAWFFAFALSGGEDRAVVGGALGVVATAALTATGLLAILDPVERPLVPLGRRG